MKKNNSKTNKKWKLNFFSELDFNNQKQIKVLSAVILFVCIVLVGTSYAWLVVNDEAKQNVGMVAGELNLVFSDNGNELSFDNLIPISDEEARNSEGYTFSVQNAGNIVSDYSIYLDDLELTTSEERLDDKYVKYSLIRDSQETTGYIKDLNEKLLESGKIEIGGTNTYTLRLWIDEERFDSEATNKTLKKTIRIEAHQEQKNKNFAIAYNYDETSCITGDEATCEKTTCYKNKTEGSCKAGTIIKYKVNDLETISFHVMFDDGKKLTMQSQKNTIYNTEWNQQERSEGPLTALIALENQTKSWSNVNSITYSAGTTIFRENPYTKCILPTNCPENAYTLENRTAKARMITMQEAIKLGCTAEEKSCPLWLRNYLDTSVKNGASVDDKGPKMINLGYWTMNASPNQTSAWSIAPGNFASINITNTYNGARAVIEVTK